MEPYFPMIFRNKILSVARDSVCAMLVLSLSFLFARAGAAAPADVPTKTVHGIAVDHIDRLVLPGDDFYEYANGAWIKKAVIPPDRAVVSVFTALGDLTTKRTSGIIEEAAKAKAPAGSSTAKIADLYNSYMDEAGIEAKGLTPLKPHLDAIAAIKDKHELAHALGETLRADEDALNNTNFHSPNLFGLWVAPGFNDSEHYAAYLLQGGIELPDREYYLSDAASMRDLRTKYLAHVSTMLKLAGFGDTDARAKRIFDLEHAIAEKHTTLAENDDIHKANNTWKQADFDAKAPGLEWAEYFRGAGLGQQKEFTVWQPTAFTAESALVASEPLETWKDWLAYHMIEDHAGVLPKAVSDESFAFFGKTLSGTPQRRPRWQRGVFVVDRWLGDAVGKIYAERYFPPKLRPRDKRWSPTLLRLSANALKRWTGWPRPPKLKPRPSSPLCMWGLGIRNTGMITRLLKSSLTICLAISGAAACLNIIVRWGGWGRKWTAKSGPCHRRRSTP